MKDTVEVKKERKNNDANNLIGICFPLVSFVMLTEKKKRSE